MLEGVVAALSIQALLAAIIGVFLGLIFGVIPGLTATLGVALLVPVTFVMDPATGMIMLVGVYAGAVYAGTITGILLNIPGTPAAVPGTIEGYAFTRRGEARLALGTATVSSGIGGLLSGLVLFTATPLLAAWALAFGPTEYAAIALLGLAVVAGVFEASLLRSVVSIFLGFTIALVGLDPITGYPRFGFGQTALSGGLGLIPVLIGVFCVPEAAKMAMKAIAERRGESSALIRVDSGRRLPTLKELRDNTWNHLRSSAIGIGTGIIPAIGPETAPFVSYAAARRASKRKKEYGKGSLEGLMATESSNNGNVGGSLIPLLALGVPGSAVAAVFVGALTLHGLRPGPTLFIDRPDVMYALFTGFIIVNIFMLVVGIVLVRHFAVILKMPNGILSVLIMLFAIIGAYSIESDIAQVWIMLGAGALTSVMISARIPVAPLVLALILGPLFESNLRRSLQLSQGDWLIFVERPISLILVIATVVVSLLLVLGRRRSRREGESASKDASSVSASSE